MRYARAKSPRQTKRGVVKLNTKKLKRGSHKVGCQICNLPVYLI